MASPIPDPAPVMSASRPSSRPFMSRPWLTAPRPGPLPASGEKDRRRGERLLAYIAAMRAARRLASGVAGSGAGVGWIFLVDRGNVQSHSSAPI